jgi:hypothetical protein
VPKQHDIDQGDQFPEKVGLPRQEEGGDTVDEGYRDCQGNQSHHAGLSVSKFRASHLQKRQPAIEENHHREQRGNPLTAGKSRHIQAGHHLQSHAVQNDRNRKHERHPEFPPEQVFMPGVIPMRRTMLGMFLRPLTI